MDFAGEAIYRYLGLLYLGAGGYETRYIQFGKTWDAQPGQIIHHQGRRTFVAVEGEDQAATWS